ncbi:hypothetical protein PHMEG_0008999, partial [Phytophthora megakarya]
AWSATSQDKWRFLELTRSKADQLKLPVTLRSERRVTIPERAPSSDRAEEKEELLTAKPKAVEEKWTSVLNFRPVIPVCKVTAASHLRAITKAAKLTAKTSLRPKLHSETRWGSTFVILKLYFELREFISADDKVLAEEMPSPASNRRLQTLLAQLADVESFSKDRLNLLDARIPSMDSLKFNRHSVSAGQLREAVALAVHLALQPFLRSETREEEPAKVGFGDRFLKRRKVNGASSSYVMLSAVSPTSDIVECPFSSARRMLRYERNRITPITLEMLLILKVKEAY